MAHRTRTTRKTAPARSARSAARSTKAAASARKGAPPAAARSRLASLRWIGAPARFGLGLSLAATTLLYVALRERMRG